MIRNLLNLNTCFILLILIFFSTSSYSQLTQRDTIVKWRHFEYQLDANGGMSSYSTTNIIEDEYAGVVIENEYVRLVVLPEFGARILSFYYKPTGHEQFYTNAVGNPYGIGEGNFYYDWLMVFGGVFPTFPEPEHGKTWFLPWKWEFTEISQNRISLRMEIQDTINFPAHPGKFNNGETEVRCVSTVSLERGKTSFDLEHRLQNTKSLPVNLEYWTCTTLAPGSEPGNTFTPANSEIIAPIDYVYLKDDWWSWMGIAEVKASEYGSHVFHYKNLAIYDNWDDMGIAYAYPNIQEDYYGVLNHTNDEAIFRVSNNAEKTPGMKFWTWGAQQGLNANPENFYHQARPYIELWSGLSTQFFEDASLDANEEISWVETYLPAVSMDAFSTVNENGALHLKAVDGEDERFETRVFLNLPDSLFTLSVELIGESDITLHQEDFLSQSDVSDMQSFYTADYSIPDGDYQLKAVVSNEEEELISYTMPVSIPILPNSIHEQEIVMPKVMRLNNRNFKLLFSKDMPRLIELYSLNGQLLYKNSIFGNETVLKLENSGLFIIRVYENGVVYPIKIASW
ncbi:MAG: hypothetical protein C0598_07560 [Marinilabiliales bacterium]|nr:MAG: hypothetical protein C0598_07560 [Marinilabiliales bacterium]